MIKDWKLDKIDSGDWEFEKVAKNNKVMTIHLFHFIPEGRVWVVNIENIDISKEFKTKSQALKFTKSYMRKH